MQPPRATSNAPARLLTELILAQYPIDFYITRKLVCLGGTYTVFDTLVLPRVQVQKVTGTLRVVDLDSRPPSNREQSDAGEHKDSRNQSVQPNT